MTPGFAGVKLYLSLPLTRSFFTLGAWMSVKVSRRGGGRASFRLLSRPMLILSTGGECVELTEGGECLKNQVLCAG